MFEYLYFYWGVQVDSPHPPCSVNVENNLKQIKINTYETIVIADLFILAILKGFMYINRFYGDVSLDWPNNSFELFTVTGTFNTEYIFRDDNSQFSAAMTWQSILKYFTLLVLLRPLSEGPR